MSAAWMQTGTGKPAQPYGTGGQTAYGSPTSLGSTKGYKGPAKLTGGMPLSSVYEQGARGIEDQYSGQAAGINSQINQLPYQQNLYLNRMNQDFGRGSGRYAQDNKTGQYRIGEHRKWQHEATNEDMRNRGIFSSSLTTKQHGRDNWEFNNQSSDLTQATNRGLEDLNTSTGRGREDLGIDYASQMSGLQGQLSQAGADRSKGLMDLLLQSAASLDQNGNLPYYSKGVF